MYSCQDRTNDFDQIISNLKTSNNSSQNWFIMENDRKIRRHKAINYSVQFTSAAKDMTISLAQTCVRLERLGSLVKTTSLFDDRSEEIQMLTTMVKEDMANLTNEMKVLQSLCDHQQSSKGTQSSSHSRSIVQSIEIRLNRLSTSFNHTLQDRVASLKMQAQRREIFALPMKPLVTDVAEGNQLQKRKQEFQPKIPSLLLEEDARSRMPGLSSFNSFTDDAIFSQQVSFIDRNNDYLESRNESIRDVERTIVDMGKIFEQLSVLIHEQGEQVDMIHGHVEETSLNVDSGHKELLKLYQSVTSNRWLMLKVLGVLFMFGVVFVMLLA